MGQLAKKLEQANVSLSRRLSLANQRAKQAKEATEGTLTAAQITMYVQLGAAGAGAIDAFTGETGGAMPKVLLAGAGLAGGSVMDSPELVALGNGALAAVTAEQVRSMLTRRRAASTPAPAERERPRLRVVDEREELDDDDYYRERRQAPPPRRRRARSE